LNKAASSNKKAVKRDFFISGILHFFNCELQLLQTLEFFILQLLGAIVANLQFANSSPVKKSQIQQGYFHPQ
jgi:hypothetical protein